eukprot:6643231-Alexandrium_andersonii.AAC.1
MRRRTATTATAHALPRGGARAARAPLDAVYRGASVQQSRENTTRRTHAGATSPTPPRRRPRSCPTRNPALRGLQDAGGAARLVLWIGVGGLL